jgi:hypothetical protein
MVHKSRDWPLLRCGSAQTVAIELALMQREVEVRSFRGVFLLLFCFFAFK